MRQVLSVVLCLFLIVQLAAPVFGYNGNTTVYITNTGRCYHKSGCSYLKSSRAISLQEAYDAGYRACSRCKPPKLEYGGTRSSDGNHSGAGALIPATLGGAAVGTVGTLIIKKKKRR